MSSMSEMIKRFRSGKPTSRDDRDGMRKKGKLREMWWIDEEQEDPEDMSSRDEHHHLRESRESPPPSPPKRRGSSSGGSSSRMYASPPGRGSYSKKSGLGASRLRNNDDDKEEGDDNDDDDLFPRRRGNEARKKRFETSTVRSSVDDFIEEDIRRFEDSLRRTGKNNAMRNLSTSNRDTRTNHRFRFIPSPVRNTGKGHNYDFFSKGTEEDLEEYFRPLSPPYSSLDSILRQAPLRSALGDNVNHDNKGEHKDGHGASTKPQEQTAKDKDPFGELDKNASTVDITADLDRAIAHLSESLAFDPTTIPKSPPPEEAAEEAALPSSIAQVAENLEMSLMPFQSFYSKKLQEETDEEAALKKKRETEVKEAQDRARREVQLQLLDTWASRWDMDFLGSTLGSDYSGDSQEQAEIDALMKSVEGLRASIMAMPKEEDKDEPKQPTTTSTTGSSPAVGGGGVAGMDVGGGAGAMVDLAQQVAEITQMVAAKVKLIEQIENGEAPLSSALTPSDPPVAPPPTILPLPDPPLVVPLPESGGTAVEHKDEVKEKEDKPHQEEGGGKAVNLVTDSNSKDLNELLVEQTTRLAALRRKRALSMAAAREAHHKHHSHHSHHPQQPDHHEAQEEEEEGPYGNFTLQSTSNTIVSDLEVAILTLQKRLGVDLKADAKKEEEGGKKRFGGLLSRLKKKDEEKGKKEKEAELDKWLEDKGDELILAMQNTEKEREEELRRKEQEQQQANEEEALPHEQRSVFSGDSDDRLERMLDAAWLDLHGGRLLGPLDPPLTHDIDANDQRNEEKKVVMDDMAPMEVPLKWRRTQQMSYISANQVNNTPRLAAANNRGECGPPPLYAHSAPLDNHPHNSGYLSPRSRMGTGMHYYSLPTDIRALQEARARLEWYRSTRAQQEGVIPALAPMYPAPPEGLDPELLPPSFSPRPPMALRHHQYPIDLLQARRKLHDFQTMRQQLAKAVS